MQFTYNPEWFQDEDEEEEEDWDIERYRKEKEEEDIAAEAQRIHDLELGGTEQSEPSSPDANGGEAISDADEDPRVGEGVSIGEGSSGSADGD